MSLNSNENCWIIILDIHISVYVYIHTYMYMWCRLQWWRTMFYKLLESIFTWTLQYAESLMRLTSVGGQGLPCLLTRWTIRRILQHSSEWFKGERRNVYYHLRMGMGRRWWKEQKNWRINANLIFSTLSQNFLLLIF